MNKIKKTLALIVSVLAMAAVFAGCSESSSASDASSSKADSSSSSSSSEITGDASSNSSNDSSSSQADSSSQPDDSSSAAQTEQTTKATEQTTSEPGETTKTSETQPQQTEKTTTTTKSAVKTSVTKAELKAASEAAVKESHAMAKQSGFTIEDEGEVINTDTEYGYWVYYHIDKNHDGLATDFVGIWKAQINKKGELEVKLYTPMPGEDKNKLESFTVDFDKANGLALIKTTGK
ncbi:MAG: hypothetical protein II574_00145 [Ruminococcus sp.]|nr:hypothetical protein [Ruminococcus sp.]